MRKADPSVQVEFLLSDNGMNDARTTERGTFLFAVDPALERVPKEHEKIRGPEKGREPEDWIMAEERRLVNQLVRAVQRADD